MASDSATFGSTPENTNYARLCRLLVDVGSTVLRDTFNSIHPPANLHGVLSSPSVRATLQSLKKKRILNLLQWRKLFPAVALTVSSANFDVTILMVLLRNVCGFSPPVSTGNWDKLPPDSDNSTEANMVRIKYYRNHVYAHATNASVDDATFNALWQKISIAILALGSAYGINISQLKTECMDPATKAHYEKLLSDWKENDDTLKETLERTHDDIGEIKEKQQKANNELGEIKENQERLNNELVEMKEIVKQFQPHGKNTKESPNDERDACGLGKYINIIRHLYKDREGWLVPFPWCKQFKLNFDNIFTTLKFVRMRKERRIKTDDVVKMFQIFQPHEECPQPRRVLIEGQPGMGKTTYCQKVALNWAKEQKVAESFPDVSLVVLLECKEINGDLWEAIDDQLLPREVKEEEKKRFFKFIQDHQSKVLLVLDGLDELPSSHLSFYEDIIQGRVLPECYLVVTARHEVAVTVQDCSHTLLKVEGFTKNDAKRFIQRYFGEQEKDLALKLLDKLDSDMVLQELTVNPLNAALLCLLWEDFQGKLPESRTLLYLEIVECVLRRYRLKMKFTETDKDLIALHQDELKQLGCIAKEGLHNNDMYFDQKEFQGFSSDLKSGLGFFSVEAGRRKRRPGRSFCFVHKTFQDFFAALYLCGQLLDGEISVDSLICDHRYFDEFPQVLMFMSGMLAQKCKAKITALITSIATQVNQLNIDHDLKNPVPRNTRLEVALACIDECKGEENTLNKEMAYVFGLHLRIQRAYCHGLNKDLAAVCIETMKTNSTVTRLELCECDIDDASAALAEQLKENSTLEELQFDNCAISKVAADALCKGLKENSALTELDLSHSGIQDVGANALAKGLKENSTVEELNLSDNGINDGGAFALAQALEENSTLIVLTLFGNAISGVGAAALTKWFKENSRLTSLNLSNNAIGDVGADALIKGLKENSRLECLKLSNNAIAEVGADALAKGLKRNPRLEMLYLSNNEIGDVGADALAKGLKENSSLEFLNLSNNAIGNVGADALAKGLEENSVLETLDLSNNAIGDVGADALAKGLKENSTLARLYLSNNGIAEVGAKALAKGLKENQGLKLLNLSHNAIGDVGADALAKRLKENSMPEMLDLSNNSIGDVGADALAKGLKENLTLAKLDLSNNAIAEVGADVLAKRLKENSTLIEMRLSGNLIDEVVASVLKDALKENQGQRLILDESDQ